MRMRMRGLIRLERSGNLLIPNSHLKIQDLEMRTCSHRLYIKSIEFLNYLYLGS